MPAESGVGGAVLWHTISGFRMIDCYCVNVLLNNSDFKCFLKVCNELLSLGLLVNFPYYSCSLLAVYVQFVIDVDVLRVLNTACLL